MIDVMIDGKPYVPLESFMGVKNCITCVMDYKKCDIVYCVENNYINWIIRPSLKKGV